MVFRCRSKTQKYIVDLCVFRVFWQAIWLSGKQFGCLASNPAVWRAIQLSGKQSGCLASNLVVWQAIRLFGKPQVEGTWRGDGKMSFGGGPKQQSSWLQDTRSACCLGHTGITRGIPRLREHGRGRGKCHLVGAQINKQSGCLASNSVVKQQVAASDGC